jgi:hypothetical protein
VDEKSPVSRNDVMVPKLIQVVAEFASGIKNRRGNRGLQVPNNSTTARKVSSPASTGGAGNFFEQHVGAHWLSLLLVRAIPPIIHDCTVIEVHFQTERLGWSTDDFLVVGEAGSGIRRKLVGQVKRSFTVSATDVDCKQTIQDFWLDFKKTQQFCVASDRFAIVTLRGTNTLLESFSGLLDCARAARDAVEFVQRLATRGFLNAKSVRYCEEIQTIIGELKAKSVSAADAWPFLRVLHVLSLDLNSGTRQTEAWIKSLLAHTAIGQDGAGAADATWHTLLSEMGEGMPSARSFSRNDLPESIRERHSCVAEPEKRTLESLTDHSALILKGIRSTIGKDLHLPRAGLVQSVIDQLEVAQVVLLSGPAGSGKSGIAKDSVASLASIHFIFSFRAEEFAHASFDETLQRIQVPANAKALGAILAGQARKILLVESVERLLEASTRDAFSDLLTLVAADKSWRLLLTCRDYSTDLVRTSFLESMGVAHSVVIVPPLADPELNEVEIAYPTIARPLSSASLRRLLRNPYTLDKAMLISWHANKPLPESEREFRTLFWRDIIRVDNRAAQGMPTRREHAFVEISLRRARALTLFAHCEELDPAVTDALWFDSLVVRLQARSQFLAPAHDVLEDWAILHWLDEQYAIQGGSLLRLSDAIGTHPAIRRAYRKWVGELIEQDPERADSLFFAVLEGTSLPKHFSDDTLVALLRSQASAGFLEKHRLALFSDGRLLFRRILHLIRVACVSAPTWAGKQATAASLFTVPDGPAWAAVLRLISTKLGAFENDDHLLLLGFIEDWSRGISAESPYPDGAEFASAIAHHLLPYFDDYRTNDQKKRALTVLAKIPKADKERFTAVLQGRKDGKRLDRLAEDLREIVLEGIAGTAACRDLPDLVVSATKEHLLRGGTDVRKARRYRGSINIEPAFGVREERHHAFFPPSAIRGPFLPLLQFHPRRGLDLLISLFNHCSDRYATQKVHSEYVERPTETALTFPDGSTQRQWCNALLWNLYRGKSGGRYVLQSALMALEYWLLELADVNPSQLDSLLLEIIRRSNSAALTAVIASVATARPRESGEALLVLLSSKECILLDRVRLAGDLHSIRLSSSGPYGNAIEKYYAAEREQADARPHRRVDLEFAILNLQVGPLAGRVHAALDRHQADLPSANQQTGEHRIWRLALHRMDLRQYTVSDDKSLATASIPTEAPYDEAKKRVVLNPKSPDSDIQQMIDHSVSNVQALNVSVGLERWGRKVFDRKENADHHAAQWRGRLEEAKAAEGAEVAETGYDPVGAGRAFVAAVCARDHWDELSNDEREWCVNIICVELERNDDKWDQATRVRLTWMSGERPSAAMVPALLGKPLPDKMRQQITRALVIALTHPVDKVRWHTAMGIGAQLWAVDRELALRCVNALAIEATLLEDAWDSESRTPFEERRSFGEIEQDVCGRVRIMFLKIGGISADALLKFDPTRAIGAEANGPILAILSQAPTEPVAIEAFRRLSQVLANWWDDDDDRTQNRRVRDHETEGALRDLLGEFLFRVEADEANSILQPILDALERHPREVSWLILGIIGIEDRCPSTDRFWQLWRLFADKVLTANWLARIDEPHSDGQDLMLAVLLGTS